MIISIIFILKQWIALEVRIDWLLKVQISLVNMFTKTVDSFESARWLDTQTSDVVYNSHPSNACGIYAHIYCDRSRNNRFFCYAISLFYQILKQLSRHCHRLAVDICLAASWLSKYPPLTTSVEKLVRDLPEKFCNRCRNKSSFVLLSHCFSIY